jgi:diguanylate cyclase (GGDEF)-like protein
VGTDRSPSRLGADSTESTESTQAPALRDLVEQAVDLALLYDENLCLHAITDTTETSLGWSSDEVAKIDDFLDHVHPEDRAELERLLDIVHWDRVDPAHIDARVRDDAGVYREFALTLATSRHAHAPGGIGITGAEVTEAREEERLLRHRALHDPLTDLPNRTLLADRLAQACARLSRGGHLLVAYIDVDHFKLVNDRHGHAIGDGLLVELARRLRAAVRPDDTVARVGGDEYVAIALTDDGGTNTIPRRLLESTAERFCIDSVALDLSLSIGVVTVTERPADPGILLRRADSAMYEAKRAGRARIVHG